MGLVLRAGSSIMAAMRLPSGASAEARTTPSIAFISAANEERPAPISWASPEMKNTRSLGAMTASSAGIPIPKQKSHWQRAAVLRTTVLPPILAPMITTGPSPKLRSMGVNSPPALSTTSLTYGLYIPL